MTLTFTCGFVEPRCVEVIRDELRLSLTMVLHGISAEKYLRRSRDEPFAVGYRLLGRTSGSEPIFEHRAAVGQASSDREIGVELWLPVASFRVEPLRLLFVNGLLEGRYWFQDRGHPGTIIPLHLATEHF